jgi:penicillin G amidase
MKRIFRGLILTLMALFLLTATFIYYQIRRTFPQIEGELIVPGIRANVRVIRDRHGIPHIYAQNAHDLYFAQGYVTAQDRIWQLEMNRRLIQGTLAGIMGEKTLATDYLMKVIGFRATQRAKEALNQLDKQTYYELEAYAAGINEYLRAQKGRLPIEFQLLCYEPLPWTPLDTLHVGILLAFLMARNLNEEIFYLQVADRLGREANLELLPVDKPHVVSGSLESGPSIKHAIDTGHLPSGRTNLGLLYEGIKGLENFLGLKIGISASNNWVVDGTKSASGKPMLANDPHLATQLPSLWYEVHLKAPGIDIIGACIPGIPYIIIGHNDHIAFGVTNVMADTIDLYLEKINPANPGEYLYKGKWLPLERQTIELPVHDRKNPVSHEILSTRHGPIINLAASKSPNPYLLAPYHKNRAISLHWTLYDIPYTAVIGFSRLNRASTWVELREAARYIDLVCLNILYADRRGNIGWQVTGSIPIRAKGTGQHPVPGWDSEYEWTGYIPFEQLPHSFNPTNHFLATANNRTVGEDYPYLMTTSWFGSYRYQRIETLLRKKKRLTQKDFKAIQLDQYSMPAKEFTNVLKGLKSEDQDNTWALHQLKDWDHHLRKDSIAAALFHASRMKLAHNTFADELGDDYPNFLWASEFTYNALEDIIRKPGARWWNNINTPTKETREDIFLQSIKGAINYLEKALGKDRQGWQWGKLHQVAFRHPFSRAGRWGILFNLGPFELGGGRNTVSVGYYGLDNPFEVIIIPTYRFIVDLDGMQSWSINSTGQSGQPFHRHYSDQVKPWAQGEYHSLPFTDQEVSAEAEAVLILNPIIAIK